MKKFFQLIALVAVAGAVSCQKTVVTDEGTDVNITFKVQLPEFVTKAIAEAENVDKLYYMPFVVTGHATPAALYTDYKVADVQMDATTGMPTANVDIRLVKNIDYKIVFWAQDESCTAYTLAQNLSTVTVDYSGVTANDDTRDAFYKCEVVKADGTLTKTVKLRRPFAQINFASNNEDWEAAQFFIKNGLKSEFTAESVPSVLHTVTGVADTYVKASFTVEADAPAWSDEVLEDVDVSNTDYEGWLAMNYVLANDDNQPNTSVSATFYYDGASCDVNVVDVPFQRNFRTNIIGNILSNEYDIEVVIVKDFFKDANGEDINVDYN